jgi:hypothetical protein
MRKVLFLNKRNHGMSFELFGNHCLKYSEIRGPRELLLIKDVFEEMETADA